MFERITSAEGVRSLLVEERLDQFVLRFERSELPCGTAKFAGRVCEILRSTAQRDDIELTLDMDGETLSISSLCDGEISDLARRILDRDPDILEASYLIRIEKRCVDGVLSVYDADALGRYLANADLRSVLRTMWSKFEPTSGLLFEFYDRPVVGGSCTIRFVGVGSHVEPVSDAIRVRQHVIDLHRESSHTSGDFYGFVPGDFWQPVVVGIADIDRFMQRVCGAISAAFLANVSHLEGGELTYKLSGYRSLEGRRASLNDLSAVGNLLFRVSQWAYVDGNADKLGLARNIISLHSQRLEDLKDEQQIMNALNSNYQVYLKANVATYLDLKGKIADLIGASTSKTYEMAEKLLDSVKNSLFVVLTFLLTVVLVNGLKDSGAQAIFSWPYLVVAAMIIIVLTLWVELSCREASRKFAVSTATLNAALIRDFGGVILPSEINASFEPACKGNLCFLNSHLDRYRTWWRIIAGLFFAFFLFGFIVMQIIDTPDKAVAPGRTPPADSSLLESQPLNPNVGDDPDVVPPGSGQKAPDSGPLLIHAHASL